MVTLLYTSGSTNTPKGAMNSYSRWNSFITPLYTMTHPLIRLAHAPLAHTTGTFCNHLLLVNLNRLERQLTWLTLCFGGKQTFSSGNMTKIREEFQLVKPNQFSGGISLN